MAGYGINQQGVENLQKLASDLHHFNDNFEEAGRALRQRVADVSDEQGVYEDEIIEIIDSVNAEQEKCREALNYLALKLSTRRTKCRSFWRWGCKQQSKYQKYLYEKISFGRRRM